MTDCGANLPCAGADPAAAASFVRQGRKGDSCNREIEFAGALPRSGTGKIQWRALPDREFD
jgi:acyl-CoA synthetase (AMP-forming)/AMP-acid ligase II